MKGVRAIALCGALSLVGCTTYYKVTDPTTGKTYYTTQLERRRDGAATLKDGRTGNMVTIQNSEVATIKKEEYESGRATAPVESSPPAK
jgi:hypothetical protein